MKMIVLGSVFLAIVITGLAIDYDIKRSANLFSELKEEVLTPPKDAGGIVTRYSLISGKTYYVSQNDFEHFKVSYKRFNPPLSLASSSPYERLKDSFFPESPLAQLRQIVCGLELKSCEGAIDLIAVVEGKYVARITSPAGKALIRVQPVGKKTSPKRPGIKRVNSLSLLLLTL